MSPRPAYVSWTVFVVLLLLSAVFVNQTVHTLPAQVAVHFDETGGASSFMTLARYRRLIVVFAIIFPIVLVTLMAAAYSRAKEMKLPNRDYWLAAERIDRTRAFLIAHGLWFGSILVVLMGFMHWLILDANRQQPPQLGNQSLFLGLLALLVCMLTWIGILMAAFRRPRGP